MLLWVGLPAPSPVCVLSAQLLPPPSQLLCCLGSSPLHRPSAAGDVGGERRPGLLLCPVSAWLSAGHGSRLSLPVCGQPAPGQLSCSQIGGSRLGGCGGPAGRGPGQLTEPPWGPGGQLQPPGGAERQLIP